MTQCRWQGGGAPNGAVWDQANNWVGAAVPVDADSVVFLQADWVATCDTGPATPVTLISIADDAGYSSVAGAGSYICYANITVTTVSLLSSTRIKGGVVATADLTHGDADVYGGTFGTINAGGANNLVGGFVAAFTADTVNLNGGGTCSFHNSANGATATTVNCNGVATYIVGGTIGTINLVGNTSWIHNTALTATNCYVFGNACSISATRIAAGNITNGPYMMNRNCVLYDHDTSEVMVDTERVRPHGGGIW